MEDLADFYRAQGQNEKAQSLDESALKIARQELGTVYDFSALPAMKRVARISWAAGDNKMAADLWRKILQVETSTFSPRHPQVAVSLIQLAKIEVELDRKGKAQSDLKQSISILERYFQADHPLVLQAGELLKELLKNH
jgi:tetratricopeptide (TPR) repeat protein